jgi:HK97 family phage major capsid protein
MPTNLDLLRSEHKALLSEAGAILDKPGATVVDVARSDTLMAQADIINARIRLLTLPDADTAPHTTRAGAPAFGVSTADLTSSFENEMRLIRAFGVPSLRNGGHGIDEAVLTEWNRRIGTPTASGSTTPGSGGYSIAPTFLAELLVAMKSQGSMRAVSDTFSTTTGAPLTWPEMADTAQSGRLLTTENTALAAATDIPFAAGTFGAYTFVSDVLPVSNQLMQDSAFDFGALMLNALALRLTRAENPYFTTGTGTGQPQGVVTAAAAGVVAAAGSTVSLTSDNLIDLLHSVDPAYRPGASWMMHDTTLQSFRKLKDTTGKPLFQTYDNTAPASGTAGGTILGYPVVINQDMPVMAASAKSVLFGSFSAYKIRTVVDLRLTVLRERYADAFQTGFIAAIRSDGRLTSAAQPIRYLQNSAT